jgi:4-azaleucine resistance transporter AzlC
VKTLTRRREFFAGMRLGVGPGAAAFVLALSFGAEATARGWGFGLPVLFSMFAFSGSAQFTLLTTLAGGSAVAAVISAVLINARYLVMSVALNNSLEGGRISRAIQAQALCDASFVVAHGKDGGYDVVRLIGASVPQWLLWSSGTAVGALTSPSPDLMHQLGLDVAFPAFFLILALDELRRSNRALVAALLGGSIAAALLFVTTPSYALLGAIAAALLGVLPQKEGDPA